MFLADDCFGWLGSGFDLDHELGWVITANNLLTDMLALGSGIPAAHDRLRGLPNEIFAVFLLFSVAERGTTIHKSTAPTLLLLLLLLLQLLLVPVGKFQRRWLSLQDVIEPSAFPDIVRFGERRH